jgi:pyruvate/2-oxoacid:ferredoxin oxidoreductase beta subunit
MTDTYTFGKIGVVNIYGPFTYDPGTDGVIETISYSYDGKMQRLTPNRAVGSYVVLMQGGVAFGAASNLFLSTNWATFHQESLGATDFVNLAGVGPSHPDFSADGGVVTIGIEIWNSMITSEQLINYSEVDNFSLDLTHGVSAPTPEPMTLTLLAIGGLLINRRRNK